MPCLRSIVMPAALLAGTYLNHTHTLLAATADDSQPTKVVRIVDGEGNPVPNARVVPWAIRTQQAHGSWAKDEYGQSDPPELTTDAEGKVTIPFPKFADRDGKVPVQQLTCRVSHPDFVETVYNDVPVTGASLHDVATIELGSGDVVDVAALSGTAPLPIADVYAMWSSDAHHGHEGTSITDEGMRRLPRLPPGPELLRLAYLPDSGEALFSVADPLLLTAGKHQRLRMQLEPAARVEGRLDESVPRPVTGGVVIGELLHLIDERGEGREDESLTWRSVAMIREDGAFTLPPMPAGELQLIALCDGFIAESGDPPAFASERERNNPGTFFIRPQVFTVASGANEPLTLTMKPTGSCRFQLTAPDGKPIAGARVGFWPNVGWWRDGSQLYCWPTVGSMETLKRRPDAPPIDWGAQPFLAVSDAQGVAVVKNVPVGTRDFAAVHDDWELWVDASRNSSGRVELKPGERSEVSVTMQPRENPASSP